MTTGRFAAIISIAGGMYASAPVPGSASVTLLPWALVGWVFSQPTTATAMMRNPTALDQFCFFSILSPFPSSTSVLKRDSAFSHPAAQRNGRDDLNRVVDAFQKICDGVGHIVRMATTNRHGV